MSVHWDWSKYFEASALGALRGAVGLPLEHPFDCVKTKWQVNPSQKVDQVIRGIYQMHGWKGFYAGAIPNGARMIGKQVYRWPMMLAFPPLFDRILPKKIVDSYPTANKTCTGIAIASFESLVICSPESLKVWLMTAPKNKKRFRTFLTQERDHLFRTLFKGLGTVYVRQMVAWVSFLVADAKFKERERKKHLDQQLSFQSLMKVSLEVGCINTLVNMPFDTTKTHIQQEGSKKRSLFKTMRFITKNYGIKGLYAGWQVRMLQYMLHSAYTVTILEKLEQKWEHRTNT